MSAEYNIIKQSYELYYKSNNISNNNILQPQSHNNIQYISSPQDNTNNKQHVSSDNDSDSDSINNNHVSTHVQSKIITINLSYQSTIVTSIYYHTQFTMSV